MKPRNSRSGLVALLIAVWLLPACGVSQARVRGKEEARRFHEQYNSSQYADMYDNSAEEFKRSVTKQQWTDFCTETRKRWGQWKASDAKDGKKEESEVWLVDSGGYIVALNYTAQFELAAASETMRFAVKDGKVQLLAYTLLPLSQR